MSVNQYIIMIMYHWSLKPLKVQVIQINFTMVVYLQEVLMNISVVVNFLSQVIFVFLLFLGMLMYA